jgi:iron complex outermembrane receptor protein
LRILALVIALTAPGLTSLAAEDEGGLEEIIVTAQKRVQRMQDVPISISAISDEDIRKFSMQNLSDIADAIPNVQMQANGGFGPSQDLTVNIRGIGGGTFFAYTDPRVAMYIDGVYMGRLQGAVLDLLDLERVEVLRGPQGTLFGKNSLGGAVSVVSKRPHDEFEGRAMVEVGNFDMINTRFNVNLPISDNVALSLAASTKNRDPFIHSLRTGDGYQDADKRSARVMLAWNPSDTVSVDVAVDHTNQRQNSSGAIYDFQGFNDPLGSGADPFFDFYFRVFEDQFGVPRDGFVTNDTSLNHADFPNKDDLDIWGGHISVTWDLESIDITNIVSYRELEQENIGDNDGSPYFISQIALDLEQSQISEELRFNGTLMNDRLEYTAGLYYFNEDLQWFAEPDGGNPFSGPLWNALESLDGPNISPPGAPTFLCPPGPQTPPGFPCFGDVLCRFSALQLRADRTLECHDRRALQRRGKNAPATGTAVARRSCRYQRTPEVGTGARVLSGGCQPTVRCVPIPGQCGHQQLVDLFATLCTGFSRLG